MTALSEKFWARAIAVTIVATASVGLSGCSLVSSVLGGDDTVRDEDGNVTEGNEDGDVFSIQVGDCLNDASVSGDVSEVPFTPCEEPHDSEAYATFQLSGDAFPGDDAVGQEADELCYGAFEDFAGIAWESSVYDYSYYIPTQDSWEQLGDREVLCTIFDPDGKVTGTLENIGV